MINNFYKNKKVLVTGATGFKGAWLCYWLVMLGAKVYGIGYNPNKNKNLFYSLKLNKKIKLKLFDIRNKKKLESFVKTSKPIIVFHLAAQPLILESYKKPYLTYTVNSLGTLNILETVKNNNTIKSLVCITSDKCYESNNSTKGFKETDKLGGEDPYSGSKASAEIMIGTYQKSFFNEKKCGIASARAGNVIGGGDWSANRLIPDSINSIMENKTIYIRNPNFNRPWQHVIEPLYGYLILAKKIYKEPKRYSGPWNFGPDQNSINTVQDTVELAVQIWGNSASWELTSDNHLHEASLLQLNSEKAKSILGWKPRWDFGKAVSETIQWYKNYYCSKQKMLDVTLDQISEYEDQTVNV